MPKSKTDRSMLIVANWVLAGGATAGKPGYRPQNPWQALEHYMEQTRGNAATFFRENGATATRIDKSVWSIDLRVVPSLAGLTVAQFAEKLLDNLVSQDTRPETGDYICVSFADGQGIGQWEWYS